MKKIFLFGIIFLFLAVSFGCLNKSSPAAPSLSVSLSSSTNTDTPPLTVEFTAVPSAEVVSYEWDFVGDGTYDGNTSTSTPSSIK